MKDGTDRTVHATFDGFPISIDWTLYIAATEWDETTFTTRRGVIVRATLIGATNQ